MIDPGSVNFTTAITTAEAKPAFTYLNPEAHVRHALAFAAKHGLPPAFAIYEPGFTRAGAALARAAGRQDAGVSLHVLAELRLRLSAQALRAGGASWRCCEELGHRAVDDRRPRASTCGR